VYLGHYVHEIVHGKYRAISNYDHTHAKDAIAHLVKTPHQRNL
jgi:hypothetical protein